MNPMVVLMILFALSSRQTAGPKPKRQIMGKPDAFDCGNVDAVAAEMANHMRGTMSAADVAWYRESKGMNPPLHEAMWSVLATWTYRVLSGEGGPMPFPWDREPDGPYPWTAERDNPATLPLGCAAQIREAVARSWAIASLSL